jgi:hypothetical protein
MLHHHSTPSSSWENLTPDILDILDILDNRSYIRRRNRHPRLHVIFLPYWRLHKILPLWLWLRSLLQGNLHRQLRFFHK